MRLKYNRKSELEVVGLGIFKPNQIIKIDDELEAKRYLDSGYFDGVKEKKKIFKPKKLEAKEVKKETKEVEPEVVKMEEKKVKKSKKKGDDK